MKPSFFKSQQWKNLLPKFYGFGAALVIIGALFKLQHWPHAGLFLSIGMFTEFFIFIISAFDPPTKEYEWDKIYPELTDGSEVDPKRSQPARTTQGTVSGNLQIDPSMSGELNNSLAKFNETVKSLHSLSSIAELSGTLLGGVQQVAGNVNTLNASMTTVNQSIGALNEAYQQTSQAILAGGKQTSSSLELLNKHLTSVNASYELYIQEHKQYVAACEQMVTSLKQSADSSKQVSTQLDKLHTQVSDLNAIYGSMISTVNAALKR